MKRILVAAFAVAVALTVCTGCASTGDITRDDILLPTIEATWPDVREEIAFGFDSTVVPGSSERAVADSTLAVWDAVITDIVPKDKPRLIALKDSDWAYLHGWALVGVDARFAAGQIGPYGVEAAKEDIEWFSLSLEKLKKEAN